MELELGAVLGSLRKWFWVPLVLILTFGMVGYEMADRQEKVYTATSTLVVDVPYTGTSNASSNSVAKQLSESYRLLLRTDAFRNEIAAEAGLTDINAFQVTITIPTTSSLLNVQVTHTDPAAALDVANAAVDVILVDYAGRSQDRLDETTAALSNELDLLRQERDAKEQEAASLAPGETASPRSREITGEITRLDQRIADTEARIDRTRLDYQLADPSLVPIKLSTPPSTPNNIRPTLAGAIGSFLGAMVGAAFILLWAVFNNVVRGVGDWQARSDVRVLGEIPHAGRLDNPGKHVFILAQPTGAPSEGIRMLVTGLDFVSFPTHGKKVLQVTSPGPSHGKTTVSANLAVHFAQLGKRVVLVDCDLHRPRLHTIFSVPRDNGLTNLIMNRGTRAEEVATRVALPGLSFIPSGALPPNPAELFSSDRFKDVLSELRAAFDVVILDTPPMLLFSDSHRIASRSDAALVVGRVDQTKYPDMDNTLDAIEKSGTELLGTIWVGSKPSKDQYYYRERRTRRFAF